MPPNNERPLAYVTKVKADPSSAPDLKIGFPEPENLVIIKPGERYTRVQTGSSPTLYLRSSLVKSPTQKYIVTIMDLDPPFPSFPFLSPIAHAVWADLVASGQPDADGFTELQSPAGVEPLLEYHPPKPPPLSDVHRYVFLVYEQPATFSGAELYEKEILPRPDASAFARVRFDYKAFEETAKLGEVVAGNYFWAN